MQSAILSIIGVACLGISGLILFKLAPRDGEATPLWLDKESTAMGISVSLVALGAFGVGMLIRAMAG